MASYKEKLNQQFGNIREENPTGAAVGALGESLIKQAATGIKHGIDTLQNYLKATTTKFRRYNTLPEVEDAKSLFMKYASNKSMLGNETVAYEEIKFTIEKTEDDLCLYIKSEQKNVKMSSPLKNKKLSKLELELENITGDLLDNINWLAGSATVDVNICKTLCFNDDSGNKITYSADYKKFNGKGEIIYKPNDQTGVKLTYTIFASKKMEDN